MANRVVLSLGFLLLSGVAACGPYVEGQGVATHSAADGRYIDPNLVRVSALSVPSGAAELGIVQAHTVSGSIEDAMPEFREQVAKLGGDFGKVNDVGTSFEMTTRSRTETYNCGSADKPRSCTRSVTESVEVATTRILGKAYRLGAAKLPLTDTPAPVAEPAPEPAAASRSTSPEGMPSP